MSKRSGRGSTRSIRGSPVALKPAPWVSAAQLTPQRRSASKISHDSANPTLAVLVKVADALQVRLEELIEPPRRIGRLYRAATLPTRSRGAVTVRRLLPESIAGLEIERMELPAGVNRSRWHSMIAEAARLCQARDAGEVSRPQPAEST